MNILGRLALLFVVVPIVELMLLIELGQYIGLLPTLGLVMLTGVSGAWLARAEGMRVFFQFQREVASGRLPGQALLDGISVLIGGAFLLTPGVITDVVGFSLLLPLTRRWLQRRVRASLERQIETGQVRVVTMGGFGGGGFSAGGFGSSGFTGGGVESQEAAGTPRMDPSKGIVIEPEDQGQ
ncbi:MAG: FxsA family protein [Longimicrobiales bacterium]